MLDITGLALVGLIKNRLLYHREENISLLPTLHVMFSERATVLCFLAPTRVGTRNVYQPTGGNSRCLYKTKGRIVDNLPAS